MKCKRCYSKMPRNVLESVCPECGWRTPSMFMLLLGAALITLLCILFIVRYAVEENTSHLYTSIFMGALSMFAWANYIVVRERRKGLGYND